ERAEKGMKALEEVQRRVPFSSGEERGVVAEVKGIGDYFTEDENYLKYRESTGRPVEYGVEIPGDAIKATNTTATTLPYPAQRPGFVPFATRRPVVADLIPQSDSDQPAIV